LVDQQQMLLFIVILLTFIHFCMHLQATFCAQTYIKGILNQVIKSLNRTNFAPEHFDVLKIPVPLFQLSKMFKISTERQNKIK